MTKHLFPVVIGSSPGHRLHHGIVGVVLIIVGAALTLTDWRDYKAWIPELVRYP